MLIATLMAAASVALIIGWQSLGLRATVIVAMIASTCLVPIALNSVSEIHHVGIANVEPQVRTFTVVAFVGFVLGILNSSINVRLYLIPFGVWVLLGTLTIWPDSALTQAGALQLLTGVAAWTAGSWAAEGASDPKFLPILTLTLVGIVAIQVLVCVAQFAGLPVNRLDAVEADILGSRVNGTANHPNNLGKLLLIVQLLLLPLSEQKDARYAKWALRAALIAFVPLGLAQGRANFAAYLSALILWALLSPRGRNASARVLILGVGFVAVLLSGAVFLARFEQDPSGGVRSVILDIAFRALPDYYLAGAGPNNYVDSIASLEGSFIPVHNTFVLLLLEAGIVGLALLAIPLARIVAAAVSGYRTNPHLRAILVSIPGWGAVGWTGWGVLGTSVLPFLSFALAFTFTRARQQVPPNDLERDRDNARHEGPRRNRPHRYSYDPA